MANYIIDVTSGGVTGSVVPDVGWRFTSNLNEVNEADLKFSGTGKMRRELLTIGSTVYIYRDGSLAFKGLIDNTEYFVGGTVVFHVSGWEVWLAKENGDYTSSPWVNTASASIFSDIIGESSYFSAGTISAGYDLDYRLSTSSSIFNGVSNLANKTGQDIEIDYTSSTIGVIDHLGSLTSVAVLNEGKEITNFRKSVGYPRGNYIEVFGKGDGDDQIKGLAQDVTSIAAYGKVRKPVIDRTVISETEANRLASAELALNKDPPHIYDFDLTNPDYTSFAVGDIITINALDQDVVNEEVRITGIEEGDANGKKYKNLQVCNPELKTLMRNKNKVLAKIQKDANDDNSYMQGSGNTLIWGSGINAQSGAPAKVGFYVPAAFVTDEAGNIRINSMTLDYDLDGYNSQYGDAAFTGSDPQVQNSSADEGASVSGDSGSEGAGVSGNSGSEGAGVSGDSSNTQPDLDQGDSSYAWTGASIGTDSDSYQACIAGSWTTVVSVNTTNTDRALYVNFDLEGVSGGPEDIEVRIANTGDLDPAKFQIYQDGFRDTSRVSFQAIGAGINNLSDEIELQVYAYGAIVVKGYISVYESSHEHSYGDYGAESHDHADGTYAAASHVHADGTYAAADHTHDDGTYAAADHDHENGGYDVNAADLNHISIGDGVSESGTVNATGVDIYLDFYNTGTGAWDNKHSVMTTGKTIDTGVDITDSGTYPDAVGYWRVRIEPNNASPDFVQGIVKIKHNLDN